MFSGMVENVLADASVEMPADLIHSLIIVLWLRRCDINWLRGVCWMGFPAFFCDLSHRDRQARRREPCPARFGLKGSA